MGKVDDSAEARKWADVLATATGPALIIDLADARFLAANAAGEALWGASRLAGACMDRAMPALARLRQRAAEATDVGSSQRETLVFWTARGSRRLAAISRRIDPAVPGIYLIEFTGEPIVARKLNGAGGQPGLSIGPHGSDVPGALPVAKSAAVPSAAGAIDADLADPEPVEPVCPPGDASPPPAPITPDPMPRRFSALSRTRPERLEAERTEAERTEARRTEAERTEAEGTEAEGTGPEQTDTEPPRAAMPSDTVAEFLPSATIRAGDAETLKEIARRIREGRAAAPAGEAFVDPPLEQVAPPARIDARPVDGRGAAPPDRPPATTLPVAPEFEPETQRLARLAHELRTPISSIAALAEVMRDEHFGPLGDKRYHGYAADIHDSARHMLGVLEGMIDPQGAVRDLPRLAMTELDLADVIQRSVRAMAPIAERAGVTVRADIAPRLPRLIADRVSVRQILLNLVSNALRYTQAGGEVRVSALIERDGRLRLAVSDTGTGMTEAQVLAVFRPEPPRTGTSGIKSSGYGLPLVRALAARNGAELAIASTPGEGTTVTLNFAEGRLVPV